MIRVAMSQLAGAIVGEYLTGIATRMERLVESGLHQWHWRWYMASHCGS